MFVHAVIIEQLEVSAIRTVNLLSSENDQMIVALANEYDHPTTGPFHFLNPKHERMLSDQWPRAPFRKLTNRNLRRSNGNFVFSLQWLGIPTRRNELSYYSLILPEYAIPVSVRFFDPNSPREYKKTVVRDDARRRFLLYLECRSSYGTFDFELEVVFRVSAGSFAVAKYTDGRTEEEPGPADLDTRPLNPAARETVRRLFGDGFVESTE